MLLVGGVLVIGFLANELFERKLIPDSIVLILLGMLLGHFTGILPPSTFIEFAAFTATIAVAVILFNTGLNLDLRSAIRETLPATILGTLNYILASAFIALIARVLLSFNWLEAIVLGTMLGGTSAAVVSVIARKLPVSEETKTLLNVESTLTNAYALVIVLTLVSSLQGYETSVGDIIRSIASSLSLPLVLGAIGGIAWLYLLERVKDRPYSHMLTISVMFLLYSLTEYLGAPGAITSFVFGLTLGNASSVSRAIFQESKYLVGELFRRFTDEITFFIKVFFFVYLGVIFVPPEDPIVYLASILMVVSALVARYLAVRPLHLKEWELAVVSFPRGLGEAVVASLLISLGIPTASLMLQITSLVIFLTNLATAVLVFYIANKYLKENRASSKT